jgi:hypothetical protein
MLTISTYTFDLFSCDSVISQFQVCLHIQGGSSDPAATIEKIGATLQQISCNLISAFQNIRKVNP